MALKGKTLGNGLFLAQRNRSSVGLDSPENKNAIGWNLDSFLKAFFIPADLVCFTLP